MKKEIVKISVQIIFDCNERKGFKVKSNIFIERKKMKELPLKSIFMGLRKSGFQFNKGELYCMSHWVRSKHPFPSPITKKVTNSLYLL